MAQTMECVRFRKDAEQSLRPLPFDDDCLKYLFSISSSTSKKELVELLGDFCPEWKTREIEALSSRLLALTPTATAAKAKTSSSSNVRVEAAPTSSSFATGDDLDDNEMLLLQDDGDFEGPPAPRKVARAPAPAARGPPPQEVDYEADELLARMLQEEEEQNAGFERHAREGGGKRGKREFRKLNISYQVRNENQPLAGLSMAAPSSLADTLRARRQQMSTDQIMNPAFFGPALGQGSQQNTASPFGYSQPEEQSVTWAERAQIAQEKRQEMSREAPAVQEKLAPSSPGQAPQAPPKPRKRNIQLTLKASTGQEYIVEVEDSESVRGLKQKIEKQYGHALVKQKLLLNGRALGDMESLRSLSLADGQEMHLVLPVEQASKKSKSGKPMPMSFDNMKGKVMELPPEQIQTMQSSQHGRIMSEEDALEAALAASLQESSSKHSAKVAAQNLPIDAPVTVDMNLEDESITVETADTEFLADVPIADSKLATQVKRAKEISDELFDEDMISKVSKRSGLRLTLLVTKNKHRSVVGYSIYKFRNRVLSVGQLAIDTQQQGRGHGRRFVKWLVQLARKQSCELVVLSSLAETMKFYQRLGFKRHTIKLEGEDYVPGQVYMEYRCSKKTKGLPPAGQPDIPSKSTFEPPAPFDPASRKANQPSASQVAAGKLAGVPQRGSDAVSRETLTREIFIALDKDRDNHLSATEMLPFARFTGFDGGEDEWKDEFDLLCSESGGNPSVGVDADLLLTLVNDESDNGCYCTDEELRDIHKKVGAVSGVTQHAPEASQSEDEPRITSYRGQLVKEIFQLLDRDGVGRLNGSDMLVFARETGFDGSAEDWEEEYQLLCSDAGGMGINLQHLMKLIDDQSDDGCYCTDEELQAMHKKLTATRPTSNVVPAARPPPGTSSTPTSEPQKSQPATTNTQMHSSTSSRSATIKDLFLLLDIDRDGFLSAEEMLLFACHTGFEGSLDEWTDEFNILCGEAGGDPKVGVDLTLLETLIDDESDNGCYCTDEELEEMLSKIPQELKAKAKETEVKAKAQAPKPATPTSFAAQENGYSKTPTRTESLPASQQNRTLQAYEKPQPVTTKSQLYKCEECQQMKKDGEVDPDDGRWYCSDCWRLFEGVDEKDELSEPVPFSAPTVPATTLPAREEKTTQPPSSRIKSIRDLFSLLDKNRNGYLDVNELRVFATFQGFDGTAEEWKMDYEELCKEYRLDNTWGVPRESFEVMLEDTSDSGCYCDDDEIMGFLQQLQSTTSNSTGAKVPAHASSGSSFAGPPGLESEALDTQSKQRNQKTPLRLPNEHSWQSQNTWWQGKGQEAAWWQHGQQDDSWNDENDWCQDGWKAEDTWTKEDASWWPDSEQKSSQAERDPWHDDSDPWQNDSGADPWQQGKNQQGAKGKNSGDKGKGKGSRPARTQHRR